MYHLDSIFDRCLWRYEYHSTKSQWKLIALKLQTTQTPPTILSEARSYFEMVYYPNRLSKYHTVKALYEKFWIGDLETDHLDHADQRLRDRLHLHGFDRSTIQQVLEYRKVLSSACYDRYRAQITKVLGGALDKNIKVLAAKTYAAIKQANTGGKPTERMLLVASVLKNREAQESLHLQDQIRYTSANSFYSSFMSQNLPNRYCALKTALACLKAAVQISKSGIPHAYRGILEIPAFYAGGGIGSGFTQKMGQALGEARTSELYEGYKAKKKGKPTRSKEEWWDGNEKGQGGAKKVYIGVVAEHEADLLFAAMGHTKLNNMGKLVGLLDAPRGPGIDGVWKNGNPPPDYFITETKYGSSKLSDSQMSNEWINGKNRLKKAVGEENEIKIKRSLKIGLTEKRLLHIDENGKMTQYRIDKLGKITLIK